MRHYQRGIATSIVLIIFLIAGVAVVSGFLIFYQNQLKIKSINSFEDCAKYYPVMESYPAQCNTPDGRHFVQELSEKEKEKLKPQQTTSNVSDSAKSCMYFKSPKFDSVIIQFMNSDNPEQFAKAYDIDLKDNKIRVDVSTFEEKDWSENSLIEMETTFGSMTEGLVRIEDLCKIAEIPEVRFIEIPAKGVPLN